MESLAYKYHFKYEELESGSYEITVERKEFSVFRLTIRIQKNYPLSEPELSFELLSPHHESLLRQKEYQRCSRFMPDHWTPATRLIDVILKTETTIYRSLIMKNQLYDIVLHACLMANVVFLAVAYFDSANGLSQIKDHITPNELYPFYVIMKKIETAVINYVAQIGTRRYMNAVSADYTYELGAENAIFNVLYFGGMIVFFAVSISEKRFRMNRKYFLIYLFLTLVNPLTITVLLTNHLRNFSYALLAASVIFLSLKEFEIAIAGFISSYCFNLDMLRVLSIEFCVLFALVVTMNKSRVFGMYDRLKCYFYGLWLLALFLGLNSLLVYELGPEDGARFLASVRTNLLQNLRYSPFVLAVLSPLLYLIYKKREFNEKLHTDFIVLTILINGVLGNSNHLLVEHTFAVFLLSLLIITQKQNPLAFAVCLSKIVTTSLLIEKHYLIKLATLLVQGFTVSYLYYRNRLLLTGDDKTVLVERKLTLLGKIYKGCWELINKYGKVLAVVVLCLNVGGLFLQKDVFGDLALITYFALLRPLAKVHEIEMKKLKKD